MTSVRVENLTKTFGKTLAVDSVSFTIDDGQLVTLLGPSGCGKSTTLRCIAGLAEPDSGYIYFDDRLVNDVPVAKRNIGLLFQRLALFPHMKVFDNVAFGLRMQRRPKDEIKRRVAEALALVQMAGFEDRYPRQLSGGQQQRVALARTMVTEPDILLFDEPLSSLDAKLRDELKNEIRRLHQKTGKTTIYVTHDQAEAFAISDKVYVMHNGKLEQEGTPIELYLNPISPFVAAFIGANNFIEARVAELNPAEPGKLAVEALGCRVEASAAEQLRVGETVTLLVRPEDIDATPVAAESSPMETNTVIGQVKVSTFSGSNTYLEVAVNQHILKVSVFGAARFALANSVGQSIRLRFDRCSVIRTGR